MAAEGNEVSTGMSVVLSVRNGMPFVTLQIDAVLAQDATVPFELVVVENGSDDGTAEYLDAIAGRDPRLRVLHDTVPGVNRARNRGIAAAAYSRIALCDADDIVEPGWLEAHQQALVDGVYGGGAWIRGALNTRDEQLLWGIDQLGPVVPVFAPFGAPSPASANATLHRRMWDECGGFDERFTNGGDETEFFARCARAGWKMVQVPDATIRYRLVGGHINVARKSFQYGKRTERAHRTVNGKRANRWRVYHIGTALRFALPAIKRFGRYAALGDATYELGRVLGSFAKPYPPRAHLGEEPG